ncbi:hypothetical protein FNO01nite_17920 [Flavobacterium noncentrifugens]|uniref:Por secretion system C-terminal sorting domain-containing protein n=1 Tax=Flavobacterium noncentrifugens TaxID=1128970 RepID=A0A1G8Y7R7_9FLAO|nr:T9SS type A sorting domain-containing protein [Flavobacterium noncentrifugens]GEP51120.1 hypothetical protein FNO01nite_17920 [Flavobacterium noncentrifugens]SDJ98836.1 Por secretion system C-terminal sorting domain-containing protein [Flavobacterium noncentrifugens]
MKTKLLPFLFLIFLNGKSFSQDYFPLLNNASWNVEVATFGGSQTYAITQNGEAIIGAHTYKKFIDSDLSREYYIREDIAAKKVYKILNGSDVLLFDFNLHVSDVITLANGNNYSVASITNINVNGGQRRQFYLSNVSNLFGYNEVWVEGVGSTAHPLVSRYEMFSDPVYYLQCSFQNGENIYNRGLANGGTPTACVVLSVEDQDYLPKISFAPNPFQTEITISTTTGFRNSTLKVYNQFGQLLREIKGLNGNKINFGRENLNSSLYFFELTENGKLLTSAKILVTN